MVTNVNLHFQPANAPRSMHVHLYCKETRINIDVQHGALRQEPQHAKPIARPASRPRPIPSTASIASEDHDEGQRPRMCMKGILSFEMIRAGADVLRDAGVSEEIANAVFDAIHARAEPHIAGKPSGPKRKRALGGSGTRSV